MGAMPPERRINLSVLKRQGSGSSVKSNRGCDEVQSHVEKIPSKQYVATEFSTNQISEDTAQQVTVERSNCSKSDVTKERASGDASQAKKCLEDDSYDVPCEQLAKSLLGKILVRRLDSGHVLKGRIVETECYLGEYDKASHSFKGRMTERNAPMFMKPGTAYVYLTYGMYHCFNISSRGPGAAVLIRALEPVEGMDLMADLRARGVKKKKPAGGEGEEGGSRKAKSKSFKPHELCSGPAKLCIAMAIDKDSCNKKDLTTWPGLSVVHAEDGAGEGEPPPVVVTKRVGIESAGREWADKPLRFYLLGNASVSKRDREKERDLMGRP